MKIVIVGCGKVGKTIIESLAEENHELIAIDNDAKIVSEIRNLYDVIAITGSGTEYQTLKQAGIDSCELFIAVTGSDEFNMLSCFVAKKMGAKYTVARIRDLENNDDSLSFINEQLELSMAVNPERMTAEAIYNILKLPSAIKVDSFSSGNFKMIELLLDKDSPLSGVQLMDLRKNNKLNFIVCAVERDGVSYVPNGAFTLKGGDKLAVITSKRSAHKLISVFEIQNIQVKDVLILGASTISSYLAKLLLADKHRVKIIEKNETVCQELCESLPDSLTVIIGDGMSQDLLVEEGILTTDAFIALTGRDQDNILMSFYAMSKEVPKVISKVNSDELSLIAENLSLSCTVSPQKIVADEIVKYARALESSIGSQIETLYTIFGEEIEALEFKVLPNFEYTNIPLKNMRFIDNVLIAGITRNNKTLIPNGDDVILPNDSVIVIAEGKRVLSLSDIIKR
ncbi:MAG: Trk system potassium transporter TrkA [Clostridia bacterium]|nr:Trk system potassium transporter TrkA [Clostridia bacterium]